MENIQCMTDLIEGYKINRDKSYQKDFKSKLEAMKPIDRSSLIYKQKL